MSRTYRTLRARAHRCREALRPWSDLLLVVAASTAAIIGVLALLGSIEVRGAQQAADRQQTVAERASGDRDAARAYQRCVQTRPLVRAVNVAIDERPNLRDAILAALRTDELTDDGHLPVPDCERTYPRGAAASARYPDAARTQPSTTPTTPKDPTP